MDNLNLQKASQYTLSEPKKALLLQGVLKSGHPLIPIQALEKYEISVQTIEAERAYFAFRIPYLPYQLDANNLVGQTDKEKLSEILSRQTILLANMSKWVGTSFSLRYIFSPDEGAIEIVLLVRVIAKLGYANAFATEVAQDISRHLKSMTLPSELVTTEQELRRILMPIQWPAIVELWQHEYLTQLSVLGSYDEVITVDAAIICPFQRPLTATWLNVLEIIAAQIVPVALNIHLEPIKLFAFEEYLLENNARAAESASNYRLVRNTYQREVKDPIASAVARSYNKRWKQLTSSNNPVLLTVQVCTPNSVSTYSVAQALASELTENHGFDDAVQDETILPSGCDIVYPQNDKDYDAALRTLREMDLYPWEASKIQTRGRLRYLTDLQSASAAFRFPVAMRGGIPGVKTRQPLPGYEVGPRVASIAPGEILLGIFTNRGGVAGVPITDFNRHALVAGTTGSGKTTTCTHLLSQLWRQGIPFLVIEPAKSEYRSLLDSPLGKDLQIFTLGDEGVSPFRLNPLEILPGVRVETHISYLRACFEAALPTFGVLPSLIEESLHNVYLDKGWDLTDRDRANDSHLMPTLGEMYFEIIWVTEERGYSDTQISREKRGIDYRKTKSE